MSSAKPKSAKKAVIAAIILVAAVFIIYNIFRHGKTSTETLRATGVMEATEVNITSKVPGKISWLCCREGDSIKSDTGVVRLEDAEIRAQVQSAVANVSAAREAVREAEVALESANAAKEGAGHEVASAESEVARLAAVTNDARENMERAKGLFNGGYVAKKELDAAVTLFSAYNAELNGARARKLAVESSLKSAEVNIKGAVVRISSAAAREKQSEAELAVRRAQLKETDIAAPINGVVVYRAFEPGEYVTPGAAIYTVDDLSNVWARIDIEETSIHGIRLGDRAKITVAGMPDKVFDAKVSEIGEVGGFATQRDVTRGRNDIKTFRVKVKAASPDGYLKPGSTVKVEINPTGK